MASDPAPATSVLQLRIALRGLSPPVWRRLLIPERVTLARLHEVIQAAMGWTDDHLHQFIIRGRRYGESRDGALQFSAAATALTPGAFALCEHEAFVYVYDFNAWWRHDIRVERRVLRQDIVRALMGGQQGPFSGTLQEPQLGSRFSTKAAIPSRASSVSATRQNVSTA
ncbi:plasmid pRiA4b ORF-3 family protein [Cupriavidus sp. 2TAF22]|uniref:plasmid pRiA4b ORF-3 family protein n=1 Tax=unclassified Cupriavidus TaxID=2640874 RepID=UPI003F932AA2